MTDTNRGVPNSDLPSASDLAKRDSSLTWPGGGAGVRTSDQAPPRRLPAATADDEAPPSAPDASPEAPAPVDAPRPPGADDASTAWGAGSAPAPRPPVASPPGPGAPAAPPGPSGGPVWGPPPPVHGPADGAAAPVPGPDLSFLAPHPSAPEGPGAVPGDPQTLAFSRGETPPPAVVQQPETSADLTTDRLAISRTVAAPASPLRRLWDRLRGRQVPQVEPEEELWRRAMRAGATTRTLTPRKVAVLCIKGGVGKTTTTFLLGATMAGLRGDRVIAVDANTDQGTLGGKLRTQTSKTIQDLLRKGDDVRGYYDVRELTSQSPTGLEVLAANEDPEVTQALTARDYKQVVDVLERSYSVILSDCGTGILHDVIRGEGGVLDNTDQLIIVSNTSINGARKAAETMDWLEKNGHKDLVRNSVSVINMVGETGANQLDLAQMRAHFSSRSRAVVEIPLDEHLVSDGIIDMDALDVRTRDAVLHLAYLVGREFSKEDQAA